MKKYYVLDTNILFQTNGNAIYGFEDNYVVIPQIVLEELDKYKSDLAARNSFRIIEDISNRGNTIKGVYINDRKGKFIQYVDDVSDVELPVTLDKNKPDNIIIAATIKIKQQHPKNKVVLVTNDRLMAINARAVGVTVEGYKNDYVSTDKLYTGRKIISTTKDIIDKIYKTGNLSLTDLDIKEPLEENEFVRLEDFGDGHEHKHSALSIYYDNGLHLIKPIKHSGIKERNEGQKYAMELLCNYNIPLNILIGPAGCGKTYLALVAGLYCIRKGMYDKLYITRSNTLPEGEDMGFLPGDIEQKMSPLLYPFLDNLSIITQSSIDEMMEKGTIEICPFAYIRGRSIPNSFIIVDEAQNLTRIKTKTLITRASENTKVVLCGDPNQIDDPRLDSCSNGLVYVSEKMRNKKLVGQVTFTNEECERSPLAKLAAKLL